MEIEEIKDPFIREVAYKRKKEKFYRGGPSTFYFLWSRTPEGKDFWSHVRNDEDYKNHPNYPHHLKIKTYEEIEIY